MLYPMRPTHSAAASSANLECYRGRRVAIGPGPADPDGHMMKDKYGLSYGDIQGLLDEAFGISVSPGGAAQVVLRVAERHEPAYEAIQ